MNRHPPLLAILTTALATHATTGQDVVIQQQIQQAIEPEQVTDDTVNTRVSLEKGLGWLTAHQAKDGSWGKTHTVAVTSFACLAYLGADDEPFQGKRGEALLRGIKFLIAQQKDGMFPHQGHSWIHGQGFATLALAEAYGRSLLCEHQPDIDLPAMRSVIEKSVSAIADNQSDSGGWWYTPGSKGQHEGSTTVTAVQALIAAKNFGVNINEDVLAKGFEYLKKCQNKDGGFDYQLGPGENSMKEGTAADVATLALMEKFDYAVMINGFKYLTKITPAAISKERFPYYGHFYGCMGMRLLGEEFEPFREQTDAYAGDALKDVCSWQQEDGAWPIARWFAGGKQEAEGYSTAFATLTLTVPEGRLSIYNRTPPKLPETVQR